MQILLFPEHPKSVIQLDSYESGSLLIRETLTKTNRQMFKANYVNHYSRCEESKCWADYLNSKTSLLSRCIPIYVIGRLPEYTTLSTIPNILYTFILIRSRFLGITSHTYSTSTLCICAPFLFTL